MNHFHRILLTGSMAMVGAFVASPAKANLILSGNLVGIFQTSDNLNTSIVNSANGDASFRTGVAVPGSFQSGVTFNSEAFSNLSSGDEISLGMFTYYNGVTKIGTSSGNAVLDLYLQLTDPGLSRIFLTALSFGIDATNNTNGNLIPDNYTVSFNQPSAAWIDGQWVNFSVSGLPTVTALAENSSKNLGSLTFAAGTVTSVAENGTTEVFLILGLVAIMLCQGSFGRTVTRSSDTILH